MPYSPIHTLRQFFCIGTLQMMLQEEADVSFTSTPAPSRRASMASVAACVTDADEASRKTSSADNTPKLRRKSSTLQTVRWHDA